MTSPRGWFAKRPPQKELIQHEKQPIHVDVGKGAFKFNTFAAVMGKKPKKPSLAFQDHPTISTVSDRPNPVRYTNRPPAKSISSTVRSGDESSEPLTPSDLPRDRISFPRSVFTLSDADPFAAGAISVPQGIADPNRLSVFSTSSANDGFSKNEPLLPLGRTSFASSSSHSHAPSDPNDRTNSPSLSDPPHRSMAPLLENLDLDITRENGSANRWEATVRPPLSKSGSFATLTDKTSSESHAPRISTRPRGYTESSSSRPTTASSYVARRGSTPTDGQPPVSFAPLEIAPCLSRKLSTSRLVTLPPTAPPVHDLPPTPLTPLRFDDGHLVSPTLSSAGTGGLSSPRTNGPADSHRHTRVPASKVDRLDSERSEETKKSSQRLKEPPHNSLADIFVQRPSSRSPVIASHTLKKSMSHSTLQKTKVGDELGPPSTTKSGDRDLKKQHSLQSPSSPQTRQHNILFTSNPSSSETNLPAEPKRTMTNSPPVTVRRRLFSGSSNRRPSLAPPEDDSQSVFSLPTEAERAQGVTSLSVGPPSDDADSDAVPSGVVSPAADYAQQIMSPAEMLMVEAVVQSEFDSKYGELLRTRQRDPSFTSAPTPHLATTNTKESLSTAPTSFPRLKGSYGAGPSLSAVRPSTAEAPSPSSLSPSPISPVGLPPPPRVRSRPHTAEPQSDLSGRRLSTLPANPLSPPPRKRTPRISTSGANLPHKSIMRKPSFLEINDEAPSYEGSFLDLGGGHDSLDLPRDGN